MITGERVLGIIHIASLTPWAYGPKDLAIAERIAAQIAGAISNAELRKEIDRRAHEDSVLAEISRVITASPDVEDVYEKFGDLVNDLIPADTVDFIQIDQLAGTFQIRHAWGAEVPGRLHGSVESLEGSLTLHIMETRRSQLIVSLDDEPELLKEFPGFLPPYRAGVRSTVLCPIIADDQVLGIFIVHSHTPGAYGPYHLALGERIAIQITGAMSNALLREQTQLLTDERERRALLDAENRELERAIEHKNRFVSTVSHELKTPLASLVASVDLLTSDGPSDDDPARRQVLEIMERSTRQLNLLIGDLVDASRLAEGKLVLSIWDVDIHELCADALTDMATALKAKGQMADLRPIDGELVIRADRTRIMQVVTNLVSNASKYSKPGSIISVETRRDGDSVVVTVRDQGIGMSESELRQMFQPFFRSERKEVRSETGTGLGLHISRELIKAHGGDITIKSELGVGTTIKFTLPVGAGQAV